MPPLHQVSQVESSHISARVSIKSVILNLNRCTQTES